MVSVGVMGVISALWIIVVTAMVVVGTAGVFREARCVRWWRGTDLPRSLGDTVDGVCLAAVWMGRCGMDVT